jgi:hypothetical protein
MLRQVIHSWERKLSQRDLNRMMIPFDWGIEFLDDYQAIAGPGSRMNDSDDPRQMIFDYSEGATRSSKRFFEPPAAVTDFSFDGHWLSFPSFVRTPYEKNNTVHARYFPVPKPASGINGSRAQEVERARGRAVIVLPQWNADVESHVGLCRLLIRADYMVSANLGRTLQACRQAVLDLRGAIDWLVAQGYDRIGITGTSIGSCIAFLAFVHDERLSVGAYNHVSSYFGDVVWEGISTAHVRRGLETALTREEVRRAWLAISPNSYISMLMRNPRRGLFLSARYDLSFPPGLSQLLFEECDQHGLNYDRTLVPWGHYTTGKTPFKYYVGYAIVNYLRKHL